MATTEAPSIPSVRYVSPEEGRAIFDEEARRVMGMSGEEFVRRWEAGEFKEIADRSGYLHIGRLASLIPLAQQDA